LLMAADSVHQPPTVLLNQLYDVSKFHLSHLNRDEDYHFR